MRSLSNGRKFIMQFIYYFFIMYSLSLINIFGCLPLIRFRRHIKLYRFFKVCSALEQMPSNNTVSIGLLFTWSTFFYIICYFAKKILLYVLIVDNRGYGMNEPPSQKLHCAYPILLHCQVIRIVYIWLCQTNDKWPKIK